MAKLTQLASCLLVLALCLACAGATGAEESPDTPGIVRQFIYRRYPAYRQGKLTHRMMKQEVGRQLDLTYSQVKSDGELCLEIEEEVERIAQACKEGRTRDRSCVLLPEPAGAKSEL